MNDVIIECAINGATSKAANPNVPIEPAEIVADALACIAAGAAIIHNHIDRYGITEDEAAARYLEGRPALERGGHLHLGLEFYGGDRTPTNVELVTEAVALCDQVGRPVASPDRAAQILGLPRGRAGRCLT